MSYITVLTDDGAQLLASLNGGQLIITRAVCSEDTSEASALHGLTAVGNILKTLSITGIKTIGNVLSLRLQINNTGVTESINVRQVGIYAKIGTGAEKLLIIMQNNAAEEVPAATESVSWVKDYVVNITVENGSGTGTVDAAAFVTVGQFSEVEQAVAEHVADTDNPHSVTAAQTGIGKYIVSTECIRAGAPSDNCFWTIDKYNDNSYRLSTYKFVSTSDNPYVGTFKDSSEISEMYFIVDLTTLPMPETIMSERNISPLGINMSYSPENIAVQSIVPCCMGNIVNHCLRVSYLLHRFSNAEEVTLTGWLHVEIYAK